MDPDGTAAPAAVQPETGQGGEPGGAPYQAYLDRIPEEHRDLVEPVFKDWDGAVTRKFQDHAQFRDQWTPYEQLGIHEYEPETLQGLLTLANDLSTPEAYVAWLHEQATAAGLLGGQQAAGEPGQPDPAITSAVQQLLAPMAQTIDDLAQWRQSQEATSAEQESQEAYASAFAELQEQHGDGIPADMIERFAAAHVGEGLSEREVIQKAFADWQAFVAQVETGVFRRGLDVPATPVTAGATPPPAEEPTTMAEAHKVAAARLAGARQ